jgi:uncharacterized protein YprB with RNaseH-like and TPR domain
MITPIWKLRKSELVWLSKHKCKHNHTYLAHYNCYCTEIPNKEERIGYLDIETSNLNADYGIVLCYCIKVHNRKKIFVRAIKRKELYSGVFDKELLKDCVRDMRKFDRIITFYGARFDIPFLRTRSVALGTDFPHYGEINHTDIYPIIKYKFKLHRNRLMNSCETIVGKTDKTVISPTHWLRCLQGHTQDMKYVVDHCERDVHDLNRLANKVVMFARKTNVSI